MKGHACRWKSCCLWVLQEECKLLNRWRSAQRLGECAMVQSLGARKFDSSLRHPCVYYICYSFNRFLGSCLSVRDRHLRQSLGGGNEFKLLIIQIFYSYYYQSPACEGRASFIHKGAKWQRNTTTISHFNLNISAGGSIPYVPTNQLLWTMKYIRNFIIHLLGGVTLEESMESDNNSFLHRCLLNAWRSKVLCCEKRRQRRVVSPHL